MATKPFVVHCGCCGKAFAAIRRTAKYCSDNCRVKAAKARKVAGVTPIRPSEPSTPEGPAKLTYAEQFVAAVRAKLDAAGRIEEPLSLLALSLAEDSVNTKHPPAARRSYTAEFRVTYAEAMRGVKGAPTGIDNLRGRRDGLRLAGSA